MANRRGKSGRSDGFPLLGLWKITADGDCSHEIRRCLLLGRKVMTNLDSVLKSKDITFLTKVYIDKATVFPVVMYRCELGHKEGRVPKNRCFQTVVLEKILESPLDCKEIKPVSPKGNQPWILIGRTDTEAESPRLWSPDMKSWLIGKDPDAGNDWRQRRRGWWDEMTGWHPMDMDMSLSKLQEMQKDREAWRAVVYWVTKCQTSWWLNNNKLTITLQVYSSSWECFCLTKIFTVLRVCWLRFGSPIEWAFPWRKGLLARYLCIHIQTLMSSVWGRCGKLPIGYSSLWMCDSQLSQRFKINFEAVCTKSWQCTLKSRFSLKLFFKKMRGSPDSPMVKIPCSHYRGHGVDPWSENKILHMSCCDPKKERKKNK